MSEQLLRFEGGYQHFFSERWGISAGAELSPVALHSSPSEMKLGLYRVDGRAIYSPAIPQDPWRLTFGAGGFYATAAASEDSLGYSDVLGFELVPGVERALDSGGTLGFQLGYGLIVNDYGMDTENREITLDASYGFAPDPDGRNISIRVEYRSFQMKINENQVSSSTVTLGAGYHW